MRSVLERDDTLSIMATSSGKLVIYPMAAMVLRGPTVVLSPLIAVPCDRVDAITAQPDGGASLIHAAVCQPERRDAFETLEEGELEFRFLAPKLFDQLEMFGRLRATR
jgi:ATP-dependent DNA helicase RecQ